MGLRTEQISYLGKRCIMSECDFLGVFPADRIPTVVNGGKRPAAYVVTIDTSDKPGKHWIAFWHRRGGEAEYFDSYGLPLENYTDVYKHLPQTTKIVASNNKCLQSYESVLCGHYCIFFLAFRSAGYSMTTITNLIDAQGHSANRDCYVARKVAELICGNRYSSFAYCNCDPSSQCCISMMTK